LASVGWEEDDHAALDAALGRREGGGTSHLRGGTAVLATGESGILQLARVISRIPRSFEKSMGVKKTGKGRRKLGQKKRRMRARIRHRKG
jgi:hypothetical protein